MSHQRQCFKSPCIQDADPLFFFAVITQITKLDSKPNPGKRKKGKGKKKSKKEGVTLWLIGKKFETTVGISFNTINHLCWNIPPNPSFSCPCCYFPSSTWYKMYILFVVLESRFSHAVVGELRVRHTTAPFGLGGAVGSPPSPGALNLPVRTRPLLPRGLRGEMPIHLLHCPARQGWDLEDVTQ